MSDGRARSRWETKKIITRSALDMLIIAVQRNRADVCCSKPRSPTSTETSLQQEPAITATAVSDLAVCGQAQVKKKIEYSKQLNASRIKVLQTREDVVHSILDEVRLPHSAGNGTLQFAVRPTSPLWAPLTAFTSHCSMLIEAGFHQTGHQHLRLFWPVECELSCCMLGSVDDTGWW